jgi:phenylalanyl-tRNA synthetase beta chain
MEIKKAKLRGVESFGMLCSARELGLSDESAGLLDLPDDLVVGTDIVEALALNERVLEINLTPNRGDCMSIAGVAREASAITGAPLHAPIIKQITAQSDAKLSVTLSAGNACPRYVGRVIKGVRANQSSPLWMRERLRRAGIRSINLLVDVTNYIVLELGQPMHAYDLAKLQGGIAVRMAREGESLELLDGRTVELSDDILVIADNEHAIGMAGVMGGQSSAISDATTDLFLEAAHFTPDAIAGRGRRFGLVTDASQRFERGVDPALPAIAIERATQLIVDYAGGTPGATIMTASENADAQSSAIRLRHERVQRVLGIAIAPTLVAGYLKKLGMQLQSGNGEWQVTAPTWRFDIKIEEDLIEEVARLHGYDNIPPVDAKIAQQLGAYSETIVRAERAADLLIDRGYQEAITYSFVDPSWQSLLFPNETARALLNPISAELGVMRVSLWPGLAHAARDNVRRQQSRVRLFEVGNKYVGMEEVQVIAGLALGAALPEQWDAPAKKMDFFDIKSDVEGLLELSGDESAFSFQATPNQALHPGQCARIFRGSEAVGWIGAIHPEVAKKLDLTYPAYVFELELRLGLNARIPTFVEISRFPAIRRDLAVIVEEAVQFDRIGAAVRESAGELLHDLSVLSVYRGEQIDKGKKSIALGLNLQDTSRTLTDEDADRVMAQVMQHLRTSLGATIRDK